MPNVPRGYALRPAQRAMPIVWFFQPGVNGPVPPGGVVPDASDEVLDVGMDGKNTQRIKSWGHDANGVHWLLTRQGTALHLDGDVDTGRGYSRFTHHLVIRNDGFRLRGLEDTEEALWHPRITVGSMYCLDTWSPHQGVRDERLTPTAQFSRRGYKLMVAVDRDEPLDGRDAWALLSPWLRRQPRDTIADAPHTAPVVRAK